VSGRARAANRVLPYEPESAFASTKLLEK